MTEDWVDPWAKLMEEAAQNVINAFGEVSDSIRRLGHLGMSAAQLKKFERRQRRAWARIRPWPLTGPKTAHRRKYSQ